MKKSSRTEREIRKEGVISNGNMWQVGRALLWRLLEDLEIKSVQRAHVGALWHCDGGRSQCLGFLVVAALMCWRISRSLFFVLYCTYSCPFFGPEGKHLDRELFIPCRAEKVTTAFPPAPGQCRPITDLVFTLRSFLCTLYSFLLLSHVMPFSFFCIHVLVMFARVTITQWVSDLNSTKSYCVVHSAL